MCSSYPDIAPEKKNNNKTQYKTVYDKQLEPLIDSMATVEKGISTFKHPYMQYEIIIMFHFSYKFRKT